MRLRAFTGLLFAQAILHVMPSCKEPFRVEGTPEIEVRDYEPGTTGPDSTWTTNTPRFTGPACDTPGPWECSTDSRGTTTCFTPCGDRVRYRVLETGAYWCEWRLADGSSADDFCRPTTNRKEAR